MACRNVHCNFCQMRDDYEPNHLCRFCDAPATQYLLGYVNFPHDYVCDLHTKARNKDAIDHKAKKKIQCKNVVGYS